MNELLRAIPKVTELYDLPEVSDLREHYAPSSVTEWIRTVLEQLRSAILSGEVTTLPTLEELGDRICRVAARESLPSLRPVINATGVILHTNLGRGCLSDRAADAVYDIARGYSTLEYNVEAGHRGSRHDHVEKLLCRLTGAESAMVVNNNAAAVMLILSTLAQGGEVITSRGELVEIGGSFRVPDIMELCGCHLREVGTTNKTHLSDYERAIGEQTRALLKVHTSNYRIVGFTESLPLSDIVALGCRTGLPVVEDLGSGSLVDLEHYGIHDEPTVQNSIRAGVDVVSFSGDKLLGGPQAGIILGKKPYIDRMKRHPLARAIRVDKMTIAALWATLTTYQDLHRAEQEIPTLAMLAVSGEDLRASAAQLCALLKERGAGRATFLPLTNLKANPVRENDLAARGGYVGLASELVQCDDRYREVMDSLLGRTIVAEDIDAATAIAKAYSYRYRVVTLDGQVVNAGGSLTGGSVNKNASILSRRGEIDALTAEAKKYAKQAEELEAQLTELRRETDTIQATVDGIEAEEKTAREDLISAQTLVDRLAANVEEAERLNEQALREYDDLTARMEQLRQQKISGGELVKKLTEEVERLTRLSAEGMAAHEMLTAAITEAAEKVTALQMEDIARQKDCEAVQMAIEQMEGQQSGSEAALAALRERQEQLKKDNEAIREEIEQITAGAQSGSSEIEELRRDIKDADAQRDQLEMRRNILSKENSDVISRREAAASELLRLQEKSEGMQEQQNSISAKMWEEYELTRSEAAEQAIPLEDVGAAQKRLSELRGKIRALGAVNVAAIEEYEEVSGRYRFMKEQIDDAENAKKELTRLITELSAQMSAIFTERFAGINRYFGEIFRELFGGGHAELRLTDATDPLETGIEIIVQPPGKIIKNLSALSGGEQAFVAICIYFAILRVNPAPFVLIDEIEAALDDVNVGKFAAYLHRMTDHTQFISITHRRGTMEQGDVLYGVTMEEEGISKLLRLDVAEMEKKFGKSLN